MPSCPNRCAIALLLLALNGADAFAPSQQTHRSLATSSSLAAEGFGSSAVRERPANEETETNGESSIDASMSAAEVKRALTDLVPSMTGKEEEYRTVESYVNLLEEKYSPVQTIDFLNLAVSGEWQLLFSTNLMGRPNRKLRLRELVQKIEADGFKGSLTNMAQWEYAEDEENFDAKGKFEVQCSYSITQGSRMAVDLDDHKLILAKGSSIPSDVPEVVGQLHRAIPKELFDPNGHAMDTTYLDEDLRIVRLMGSKYEGVRNIFMRKGSLEIKPMM